MLSNIKVSIIVPIYNVEKYLKRCLISLKNQTLEDIEVILVNDGSTDLSANICKEFINEYDLNNKFKYLEKKNGGLSDARNYGIKYANGKYIAFLDSDDYVKEEIYEKLYNIAEINNALLVECEFFYKYEKNIKRQRLPHKYSSINDYLISSSVVAWNKLINREWLLRQNIEFKKGIFFEDLNFFFKLYSKIIDVKQIVTLNEPLIYYVQRKESITNSNILKIKKIVSVYEDIIEYFKINNLFYIFKDEIEYKMSRNLFGAFFKKILMIKDKKVRNELIIYYWNSINLIFPDWKKNKYINDNRKLSNIYLKHINKNILIFLSHLVI